MRALVIVLLVSVTATACAPPELLEWEGPEDRVVDQWWQNVDTNEEEYEGTCALLQGDGVAYALVPAISWMYKTEWSAGGPGVIVLREGKLRLGAIELEPDGEDVWHARYSGFVLGGMEAMLVPGCDAFDTDRIVLD
ncbi:MAG: hypothetical protein AAF211_13880 [Myxococcota bacterium]